MKYRLNKLPVKTTNNFKVNDLEIELDILEVTSFKNFQIQGDIGKLTIETQEKAELLKTKIGLDFHKYLDIHIVIPKGVVIDKPITFEYDFSDNDVLVDKITFDYEENSSADFIFTYKSIDDNKHFHHLYEVVKYEKGAKGNITFIILMNSVSYNFIAMENECCENSSAIHNVIDLGGCVRVYNAFTNLFEYSSKCNLNHIYIGKDNDVIDINYYLKNIGCESNSLMNVQGAIDDNCRKIFRGTIDFIKGSVNSIGSENENCVLLSDTCRSTSLPQMLCEEENVVGSHGVSSGKVSDEKLFYIMSRGFSKKDAERLIVLGNFSSILNSIPDDDVRESIMKTIEDKLS